MKEPKKLTPPRAKFVAEYLKDGNATRAYVAAGFSPKGADGAACKLLKCPDVQAAVTLARNQIVEKGIYNLEMAMKEAEEAIEFARETENANAYVKAVELRSKLNGLLIEKHDHRVQGLNLVIHGFAKRKDEEDDDDDFIDPFT